MSNVSFESAGPRKTAEKTRPTAQPSVPRRGLGRTGHLGGLEGENLFREGKTRPKEETGRYGKNVTPFSRNTDTSSQGKPRTYGIISIGTQTTLVQKKIGLLKSAALVVSRQTEKCRASPDGYSTESPPGGLSEVRSKESEKYVRKCEKVLWLRRNGRLRYYDPDCDYFRAERSIRRQPSISVHRKGWSSRREGEKRPRVRNNWRMKAHSGGLKV